MDVDHPAFAAFLTFFNRTIRPLAHDGAVMAELARLSELRRPEKLEHLIIAGQPVEHIMFVHEGLIRYYYLDEANGDERTGQFFEEKSVYTDVASFVGQFPTDQYIQALTSCEILMIPRAAVYSAFNTNHGMERFARMMVEQALTGSQRRTANLMTKSLDERYRHFVAARPSVARRVPQYLIAGFLGVTPEALARARRRTTRLPLPRPD